MSNCDSEGGNDAADTGRFDMDAGAGSSAGEMSEADPNLPFVEPAWDIQSASVTFIDGLDVVVFEQSVAGMAGSIVPVPVGQVDGATVLGYVFPTTLQPSDVGFGLGTEGIVALSAVSHPDFDDTPLWDENMNLDFADDGAVFHMHWVILVEDQRALAGLAVRQASEADKPKLGPTAPMQMYLNSPGYSVALQGGKIRVTVPLHGLSGQTNFLYDAVTARMQVDASGESPLLKVEEVYDVLSGDLSLPFEVRETSWP